MKRYIVEFIGTFFLVFTIAFTGNPLAIAGILAAMLYMGGYISGGHYNPAVTIAVLIRGKIGVIDSIMYIVVQILAGAAAAALYISVTGEKFLPEPSVLATYQAAIIMEALFTFALASVVLHVATSEETVGNQYYGVAIALVIMTGVFAGGLSGGVYNPAVALGAYIADYSHFSSHLKNLWIYLIGPLSGGILGGILFRLMNTGTGTVSDTPSKSKERHKK